MFYENYEKACQMRSVDPYDIARKCGVSKNTPRNWQKDGTFPSADKLILISKELDVTVDYLLFGAESSPTFNLSLDQSELLTVYNQLSEINKKEAISAVNLLLNVQNNSKPKPQKKPKITTITMKCSRHKVSAGKGYDLNDSDSWREIDIVKDNLSSKADFIVEVEGNSMETKYYDGDYVYVKAQQTVDEGDIGIFSVDGKGYIKKLGKNILISLNKKCDNVPLTNTTTYCYGLVLGKAELAQ